MMARVFEVDVLRCERCGARMRILADIHSPDAIRAILDCLGLPSRAPPIAPAAYEGELQAEWLAWAGRPGQTEQRDRDLSASAFLDKA